MNIDTTKIPWLKNLEDNYQVILDEWRALPPEVMINWPQEGREFMRAIMPFFHGEETEFAALCPNLMRITKDIPNLRMVSIQTMDAGGHLPAHTGATTGVYRVHMGLDVKDGNWIEVNRKRSKLENGKCFVFDDTQLHEVGNESGAPRTNLILDSWAPYSVPGERVRRVGHRFAHAVGIKRSEMTKYFQATKVYATKYKAEHPEVFAGL